MDTSVHPKFEYKLFNTVIQNFTTIFEVKLWIGQILSMRMYIFPKIREDSSNQNFGWGLVRGFKGWIEQICRGWNGSLSEKIMLDTHLNLNGCNGRNRLSTNHRTKS